MSEAEDYYRTILTKLSDEDFCERVFKETDPEMNYYDPSTQFVRMETVVNLLLHGAKKEDILCFLEQGLEGEALFYLRCF